MNNKDWNDTVESSQTICNGEGNLLTRLENAQVLRNQSFRQAEGRDETVGEPITGRYNFNVNA